MHTVTKFVGERVKDRLKFVLPDRDDPDVNLVSHALLQTP